MKQKQQQQQQQKTTTNECVREFPRNWRRFAPLLFSANYTIMMDTESYIIRECHLNETSRECFKNANTATSHYIEMKK